MFYPTVISNKTNITHMVKDKKFCECGEIYNTFSTFSRKDLRKIKFRHYSEITCPICRTTIEKLMSP